MILSYLLYGLCFVILATRREKGAKALAGACITYLILDNVVAASLATTEFYDITLIFSIMWVLDFLLLMTLFCIVRKRRQIIFVFSAVPLILCQFLAIQYPSLFPEYIYVFSIQDAHRYFIEVLIFVYSWKDNTVKEWIRTGCVIFLTIVAHLM